MAQPRLAFYDRKTKLGHHASCKTCCIAYEAARCDADVPRALWKAAKARATKRGLPFSITPDDVVIPARCPVLDIPLVRNPSRGPYDSSPSLDRKVCSLGYVPGNVVVISWRANRIKNDATAAEVRNLLAWMEAEGLA